MITLLNIGLELFIMVFAFLGLRSQFKSGTEGGHRPDMFVYYTNLSNLAVLIFFFVRALCNIFRFYDNPGLYNLFFSHFSWFSVTLMIFVTFLIYHFLLLPSIKADPVTYGEFSQYQGFGNKAVHYTVPLLSVVNWLVFESKGAVRWYYAILWIAIPLVYAGFAFLRGALVKRPIYGTKSRYPYEFMSPDLIGWEKVLKNIGILLGAFIALGFIMFGAGRLIEALF